MALLEPDRNQIEIFVEALFRHVGKDGWISMRTFYENDESSTSVRTTPTSLAGGLNFVIDVAEDDARRAANEPKATVFCPPVAVFSNKNHARENDLFIGPVLAVECDKRPHEARAELEQLLGPPTLIVRSGGHWTDPATGQVYDRVHLYWRLTQGAKGNNLEKLKQARKLATYLVGGDTSNVPICHPIRWPGSWHRKGAPRLCEIVELYPDREIDLDWALAVLTAAAPPAAESGNRGQDDSEPLDWSHSFNQIITGELFHPALVPLAASFAAHGLPELAARRVLRALLDSTQTTDSGRLRRRDTELSKLRDTVHSGYRKFHRQQQQTGSLFDPWAKYIVPEFPLDILPPVLQEFVTAQANVIGCCPAGMAMATLANLSAATSHGFLLKMMEHGPWHTRPRLWVLLIGDPSVKKTPPIDAATAPLEFLQAEIYRDYEEALALHKQNGGKKEDEPEPPPRYVTNDVTIEKLGDILSRSDRGVLVKRDELVGWIGAMDRYSGASRANTDRAFWLDTFNGGRRTVDRISRGEIFIPNLSVSILGGIQPDRLAELKDLMNDGLLQRFLPVMMAEARFTRDEPVNQNPYWNLVRDLASMPPQHLSMTDKARETITDLRRRLFELERESGASRGASRPLSASSLATPARSLWFCISPNFRMSASSAARLQPTCAGSSSIL